MLAWACRGTLWAETHEVQVGIDLPGYFPDDLTIKAGDTVNWVWVGGAGEAMGHSVTSGNAGTANGLFDSGIQHKGFTFSHTFQDTGSFPYYCIPHYAVGMQGVVKVVAASTPSTGMLGNISTRLRVGTGDDVLVGGLVIEGNGPKQVLVRALGPTLLTQFGLSGALADPTLELHDSSGATILANDNWADASNAQSIPTGLRPPNSLESALLTTLNPGAYTAIVHGVGDSTGVALVEAYDIDPGGASHLANISTRGFVQTGNDVMIGGLIVQTGSENVLVRALGPTLGQPPFNLSHVLADPTLELRDGNGNLLAANDNWKSTQQAEIISTGRPPPNDSESAIVHTLTPGGYTAIVGGANNTTGLGLVEVYALP